MRNHPFYPGSLALLVVLASLLAMPVEGWSQPKSNDNEILLSASLFRPINSGSGAFNADAVYSYHFANPRWEVGLRQSFVYTFSPGESDVWNAVTAPLIRYNLLSETLFGIPRRPEFVPFIGGLLGAVWNDNEITGTAGPEAGLRWYARESTFLMISYRYERFFESLSSSDRTQSANNVVALGIGFNWGGRNRATTP
jgi:hypothetical protein